MTWMRGWEATELNFPGDEHVKLAIMKLGLQSVAMFALLVTTCTAVLAAPASADPQPPVTPDVPTPTEPVAVPDPAVTPQQLHNVTYRARIDGISRGALVTYKINDSQVQSTNPTMLPGRVFEAQSVLSDPTLAGMQVSVQWPYSANLHCEILVDDQTVAEADQFIRPRLTPADNDPDFGKLMCGAPLVNPVGATGAGTVSTDTTVPGPLESPTPVLP
jgi:hypothetical protein